MLPVLFPGTIFETPTYYVLYLLGFLGAILISTKRAEQYGLPPVRAIDFGFFIFLFGVAGARLAHILIEAPAYYWEKPIRVFYFWQGGFVLYGGIIAAFLSSIAVVRYFKEPFARWCDVAASGVLLGIGIGRLGCLAAGCCFGRPTDWWWGMTFTHPLTGAPRHVPLHPTQLLESLFGLLLAAVFWKVYRKPPKREGEALAMAFLSYALFRFVIEYFRGDLERGVYFGDKFSTSQMISLLFVFGCLAWIYLLPKIKKQTP